MTGSRAWSAARRVGRTRLQDRDLPGAGGVGDRADRDRRARRRPAPANSPDGRPSVPARPAPCRRGRICAAATGGRGNKPFHSLGPVAKGRAKARSSREALVEEGLELGEVLGHQAGRRRRGGRTSGVARALRLAADLAEHPFEIGLDEAPGAHVLRLLLAPDHIGLLEPRKLLDQALQRERIELLDAQKVDVVDAALLALLIEVVIDLARAEDDAADLVVARRA